MSDELVSPAQSAANTGTILGADPSDTSQSEKSLAELLGDLSQQTGTLVRQELELAKSELVVKGKSLALGSAMFGGAGLLTVLALGALVACAIAGLAEALPVWLAALIVALVLLAAAGLLGILGRADIQRGSPPVPEEAVESTKEDVAWLKTQMKSAKP